MRHIDDIAAKVRRAERIDDMHRIVRAAGYRAVERDTFYNEI